MHLWYVKEGTVSNDKLLRNFSASMAGLVIPGNTERTDISSSTFNRFKSNRFLLTHDFHLVIGTIRLELESQGL
jgi:hypothetical protein